MKRTVTPLLIAALALPLGAETLTPQQSLHRALQTPVARTASRNATTPAYTYAGTIGRLYAFDRNDGNGAIITTDDSNLLPVVAIIDSGTSSQLNPAAKVLLDDINAQIAAAKTTASRPVDQYMEWPPIEPVTTTLWDQFSPYNDNCPKIGDKTAVTGCVATAMAQIIAANGYAQAKGSIKYNFYYAGSQYSHSFDFAANPIDFPNLKDTYSKSDSGTDAGKAVANLMAACGASVQMNYDPYGSGASVNNVATALVKYFGYPQANVTYLARPYINTARWEGIIYEELSQGRPVYYAGYTPSGGGHSFVCDGYASDGLFHFNFGWSGFGNGYYAISAINPDQQGIGSSNGGYNTNQELITVCPPSQTPQKITIDYSEVTSYSCALRDLALSGDFKGSKQLTADFVLINTGNVDINFQPYATIQGSKSGWQSQEYVIIAPGCSKKCSITIPLVDDKTGEQIADGSYTLIIADDTYKTLTDNAKIPFTIADRKVRVDFAHDEKASFAIPNLDSFPTVLKSGTTATITAMCNSTDPVALSLAFYTPGSNTPVYKTESQKTSMPNTNGEYQENISYKIPSLSLSMGMYDVQFMLYDSPCSPRKAVAIQGTDGGLTFTPLDEKGSVEVTAGKFTTAAVEIPSAVKIGDNQFTVTRLGAGLLEGNTKVQELTLPASLNDMGHHSIYGMSQLQKLTFNSTAIPFEHIGYPASYLPASTIVYCPEESTDKFSSTFAPRRVMPLSEAAKPWEPITFDPETSIQEVDVTADCLPAYNLQGRRITSPTGLHIQGGKLRIGR